MSDSGNQQPWSPGGQPAQNPGWGQQPGVGTPPSGYGAPQSPPAGPPPGGYNAPGGANPAWSAPQSSPKASSGLKLEMMTYPWLLAAVGILIAFASIVVGDIIACFEKGLPGRLRFRQFFDFGSPGNAALLLLGIALVVLVPKVLADKGESTPTRRLVIDGLLVASLAVGVAAVLAIIADFTLFGDSFALSFQDLLSRLGAIALAAATAYWALANRSKATKSATASAPPPPPWGPAGGTPGSPPSPPTTGFQPGQYQQPQQGGYAPPARWLLASQLLARRARGSSQHRL